jgi:hypothetical protein
MTRNQKIALGCGGAGCLGLIVVVVAGCLLWFFYYRSSRDRYDRYANINISTNRNFNLNSNENENSNDSADSSSSNSSDSAGEYTDDEKHRLFHASSITADYELQRRVWTKIGILEDDFSQGDKFTEFGTKHGAWVLENYQWVALINTPEKGRAYVNAHLH